MNIKYPTLIIFIIAVLLSQSVYPQSDSISMNCCSTVTKIYEQVYDMNRTCISIEKHANDFLSKQSDSTGSIITGDVFDIENNRFGLLECVLIILSIFTALLVFLSGDHTELVYIWLLKPAYYFFAFMALYQISLVITYYFYSLEQYIAIMTYLSLVALGVLNYMIYRIFAYLLKIRQQAYITRRIS